MRSPCGGPALHGHPADLSAFTAAPTDPQRTVFDAGLFLAPNGAETVEATSMQPDGGKQVIAIEDQPVHLRTMLSGRSHRTSER